MDYIKYKLVEGYEDYIIFTTGKLFSNKSNKFLKHQLDHKNYYYYSLTKNLKLKKFKTHRLLALAFISNPNNLLLVDHINRVRNDNNLKNLRWADWTTQNANKNISKNNKTGIIGVICDKKKNMYRATWRENTKKKEKTFSIKKYGKEEALRLAIEYRKEMEIKHYSNII